MKRLTHADRELAARLDAEGTPRVDIARQLGVSGTSITMLLGARRAYRGTFVSTATARRCPSCDTLINRYSKVCRPCYLQAAEARRAEKANAARVRAVAAPRPEAAESTTYVRVPVPPLTAGESAAGETSMWPGCPFTWACPSQRAAAVMRAIFAGQIAYVPSRRAFAAGIADEDAIDEAEAEAATEAVLAAALDERRARLNAWLNGPDDARYEAVAS